MHVRCKITLIFKFTVSLVFTHPLVLRLNSLRSNNIISNIQFPINREINLTRIWRNIQNYHITFELLKCFAHEIIRIIFMRILSPKDLACSIKLIPIFASSLKSIKKFMDFIADFLTFSKVLTFSRYGILKLLWYKIEFCQKRYEAKKWMLFDWDRIICIRKLQHTIRFCGVNYVSILAINTEFERTLFLETMQFGNHEIVDGTRIICFQIWCNGKIALSNLNFLPYTFPFFSKIIGVIVLT